MQATLFLDLDDVLCLNAPYGGVHVVDIFRGRCAEPDVVFQALFAPECTSELRRVHEELEGRLRYVISSTWRETFSHRQMVEIFRRSGLAFVADSLHAAAWCTSIDARAERIDEVLQWLDAHHRGEPFAVLDDDCSGGSFIEEAARAEDRFRGRVVLCREGCGLSAAHADSLIQFLGRQA